MCSPISHKYPISHINITNDNQQGIDTKMKKTLLASALIGATFAMMQAQAAHVPEGVKLADKQELVRGGGSEPATLDPQKIEGTPGSHRARDLFEGLYKMAMAIWSLVLLKATQPMRITQSTLSPCVKMPNGLTVIQSPPMTLFMALPER